METLFIVFLVLKLTGIIDWSWWLVALPAYWPIIIMSLVFLCGLVALPYQLKSAEKRREAELDMEDLVRDQINKNRSLGIVSISMGDEIPPGSTQDAIMKLIKNRLHAERALIERNLRL